MSRFLKKRHYALVLPAILVKTKVEPKETLEYLIQSYMNTTGVSYTQEDVAEIQSAFIRRYGTHDPAI